MEGSLFPIETQEFNGCHVVLVFNNGYSKLVVDGGSYKLYNGDNVSPYIFDELHEILRILPSRKELPMSRDGKYLTTWNFIRNEEMS
jgi:hypothetical protein